jgi:F0F1-type ATP synthase epsilon subunit
VLFAATVIVKAMSISKTTVSRGVRRVWGLELHGWEQLMLVSLGFAALAAVFVTITTGAVVRLQKIEAAQATAELDRYKAEAAAEVGKAHERIAELSTQAESLKLGTAEANARALEAQLALEKLKQPRSLSEKQISVIVEKLMRFAGTNFDAAVIPGDPEAIIFLSHITAALEKAGWKWIEWAAPDGQLSMTYSFLGKPSIGQLGFFGVTLQINPTYDRALSAPADALGLALIAEGIEATLDVIDDPSVPKRETVHVIVGEKRQ